MKSSERNIHVYERSCGNVPPREPETPSPALAASRTLARPVNPMAHYPNDDAGYTRCYESTKRSVNAGNVNKDDCDYPGNHPGQHTPF
jgi:hypothetical protein